jgi:hypothetical protein
LSLVLEEYYKTIKHASVSSKTGAGFDFLFEKINESIRDYINEKEKSC